MRRRNVSPTKYGDAEKRRDGRRESKGEPISRIRGFQDGLAVIRVVDRSSNPDDQADGEQEYDVMCFHRFPIRRYDVPCGTWIICTTWYIECKRKRDPISSIFSA